MPASLEPGVVVARYSIIGPIGAGGMGEVYKAQDSSLERMIALKILPSDVVKNDERRRRFVQEARSASSLNHPHIITIHEIGEAAVEPSGQVIHYIAMELIDGSTLKRKIHQEQTDLRTLLTYLAQAADGLAKAHAAGIVHRDLKPENIMVTRDGFAKVLDFGLAKLSVRRSASETVDATAVRDETREGAILGTVAYMAPEQVMGKVVDHRCDIFSFGAILYEAATRRRPFEADSDVDVMHKILHDAPEPVEQVDATVPSELRRMIRRCLMKDPDRRYQSMKDLAIELREIVEEYAELSASASSRGSGSGAVAALPVRKSPAALIAVAIAVLAIGALAFVYLQGRQKAAPADPVPALSAMQIQRLTTAGNVSFAAISGDGRYMAHVVSDREGLFSLRVRQIATGSDVEIVPAAARVFAGLAFSPDGNYIYYSRRDVEGGTVGWLYQVPVLGGVSRKVIFDVDTAPEFSPDGKQLAFGRGLPQKNENHIVVANIDGTGERAVAVFPRYGAPIPAAPAWSPDGRKLLAARLLPGGAFVSPVEIDLGSGARRDFSSAQWWWITSIVYAPDASRAFVTGVQKGSGQSQIWVQPLPDGEPRRITNDFSDYLDLSITADGRTLSARSVDVDGEMYVASVDDPTGGQPLENERSRGVRQVAASAAGVVVYARQGDGLSNLVILEDAAAHPRLLTTDGASTDPSISADGKTIVYNSWQGDQSHIWTIDADGGGARQITHDDGEYLPQISPDGKMLLYMTSDALWKRPLAGGDAVKVADRPTGNHGFSSDSKILFYRNWSGENPSISTRVEPAAGGAPLFEAPSRGGRGFQFNPTNDGLTFIRPAGGAENLFVHKFDGSQPVQLTRLRRGGIGSYAWTPDGKLIYVLTERRADAALFTGF